MSDENPENSAAALAVKIATDLANRTDVTTQRLTDIMGKLSDTVIKFGANMDYLQKDIADIKSNLTNKYVTDEAFLPIRTIQVDHEKRIRYLERLTTLGLGVLFAIELGLKFLWH